MTLAADLDSDVAAIADEMTEWRHLLHAEPELGFEEHKTSAFIAKKLREWGIPVTRGIGGTGLVGTLAGNRSGNRAIAIRADMDALPMQEAHPLPYASRRPGIMHACGHDGHMAALLGAARVLGANPDFAGTVHFIFQPAEEGRGGARAMLADGLFDRFPADEIYAFHNSERPLGQIAVGEGPVAAAADRFVISIHGRGGHAAAPHLCIDPIPIAARLLLEIEALPGRLTDVVTPAIVTVGAIHAGDAFNIIPETATLTGTVRCFDRTVQAALESRIRTLSASMASAYGARAEIAYESPFAPTVNSPAETGFAAEVAESIVGAAALIRNPPPEMGSEDFSFMLEARPGCYLLIGQNDDTHTAFVHDPNYDFNDAILPLAATLWVRLAKARLSTDLTDPP